MKRQIFILLLALGLGLQAHATNFGNIWCQKFDSNGNYAYGTGGETRNNGTTFDCMQYGTTDEGTWCACQQTMCFGSSNANYSYNGNQVTGFGNTNNPTSVDMACREYCQKVPSPMSFGAEQCLSQGIVHY